MGALGFSRGDLHQIKLGDLQNELRTAVAAVLWRGTYMFAARLFV